MARVTGIRAVNVPVEDPSACREFYRDQLGMHLLPDVLPDGTMCRLDADGDQFVGLRPRGDGDGRRWRYPYGRSEDWDHAELYVDGSPDVAPVETHAEALVLADPDDHALEALLSPREPRTVPGIAEVGLRVTDPDRAGEFYDRLGFEPATDGREDGGGGGGNGRGDGNRRVAYRAASGQRWVLVESDRPGLHHVTLRVEPSRFDEIAARLPGHRNPGADGELPATDPEGRELGLVAGIR